MIELEVYDMLVLRSDRGDTIFNDFIYSKCDLQHHTTECHRKTMLSTNTYVCYCNSFEVSVCDNNIRVCKNTNGMRDDTFTLQEVWRRDSDNTYKRIWEDSHSICCSTSVFKYKDKYYSAGVLRDNCNRLPSLQQLINVLLSDSDINFTEDEFGISDCGVKLGYFYLDDEKIGKNYERYGSDYYVFAYSPREVEKTLLALTDKIDLEVLYDVKEDNK